MNKLKSIKKYDANTFDKELKKCKDNKFIRCGVGSVCILILILNV